MNDTAKLNKDKFVADLKVVVADAEELLKLTAGQAGERLSEVRTRLADRLVDARARLGELEAQLMERTKEAARATDQYVHDHPWKAIGAASGVAFLLGLLIGRR